MSLSSNQTDSVNFTGITTVPLTESDYYIADYFPDEDKIRDRTCSSVHHSSFRFNSTVSDRQILELKTFNRVTPSIFIYDRDSAEEKYYESVENIPTIKNNECLWINITGVHDKILLANLSRHFKIHPLVILDIETTEQRTKLDINDDALFLVVKLIYPDSITKKTHVEQISFYVKENLLISFQQQSNDIFDRIKTKIHQNKGRIRRSKVDYLFYSLIDIIVDQYMDVLDIVNTKVEAIDHQLMNNLSRNTLETIYDLKRDMLDYRRAITPLKDIINRLQKEEETHIIQESTIIYLKDLYDHVVQVTDTIDTYREVLASFIDIYMMLNSNAMNEVVKTLTIISTIFIPLTFIAGLYGMNFDNMPGLRWKYGYYVTVGIMALISLLMLLYFKRKKWIFV